MAAVTICSDFGAQKYSLSQFPLFPHPFPHLFTSCDQNTGASHSSKVSILWCSDLFMVQLSQLYVTTGKTTALTIQTFISRVMSLLFNTLSRFVIAFLPRRNHLISWLYSSSSAQKEEICHYSTFSPALCHEVIGLNRASLVAQW